jgi:lambda family phage tail tape measure protein
MASIEALPAGPAREAFKQQYAQILDIPTSRLTAKNVAEAVGAGGPDKMSEIESALGQVNKRVQESSLYLKGLKDSGDLAEKSMTNFMNSMKDSSPMTTFFSSAIKYSGELNKALTDESFTTVAAGLDKLSNTDLSLFGTAALDIQNLVFQFNDLKPAYESAAKQLEGFRDKLAELQKRRQSWNLNNAGKQEIDEQIAAQLAIIAAQEQGVGKIRSEIQALGKEAENFIKRSITEQVAASIEQFKLKLAQVQLQSQKDIVSKGFADTVSGTKAVADISKRQVDVELELITSQDRLADRIELLRLEIQDAKDREMLKGALATPEDPTAAIRIQQGMRARELKKQFLETGGKFNSGTTQKSFDAQLQELQKQIPENTDLLAIQERRTKTALGVANAAAKKLSIDFDAAIKILDIEAKRQTDKIQFEFDKLNNIIGAIGSDTPERLGAQLDLVQTVLQEQYKLIDQAADAALQRAQTARDMALKAGQDRTQVGTQFAEKTGQIELERSRKKELLAQKTALEEQGKQAAYNLQITERTLDREIKLANARKSGITGTTSESERRRQDLDRSLRGLQMGRERAGEAKTLAEEEGRLNVFREDLVKQYGVDGQISAGDQARLTSLSQIVDKTREQINANEAVRKEVERTTRSVEDFNLTTKEIAERDALRLSQLEAEKLIYESIAELKSHELAIEQQRFDILDSLGMYTQDEKNRLSANLQIKQIDLNVERELRDIAAEKVRLELALAAAKRAAEGVEKVDPKTDPSVIKAEQDLANLDARRNMVVQRAENAKDLVERSIMVPDRFKNFANEFEKMFDGMADAIVNWATTGKGAFKDVINSFLQDILRYEMRLQMHALYVNALKPLLGKFVLALMGPGGSGATSGANFVDFAALGSAYDSGVKKYAMGGAMDYTREYSIPGYAKGGMFTNKIVNKPTLFKAADGLGLMGEAGPEAIMPLSRMKDGALGVKMRNDYRDPEREKSSTGNVKIDIHNYSGQQVQQKETTDSQGNRRVELIIGEMASSEITRSGGSTRQAISSTFGIQPTLIRR